MTGRLFKGAADLPVGADPKQYRAMTFGPWVVYEFCDCIRVQLMWRSSIYWGVRIARFGILPTPISTNSLPHCFRPQ
jgi:hypothetical protein